MNLKSISKALAALGAGVTVLIAQGLLHGEAEHWTVGLLATVGATLAVYLAPRNEYADDTQQHRLNP